MAVSPDGSSVVSAAADETLRFWEVFAPTKAHAGKRDASDLPGRAKSKKLSPVPMPSSKGESIRESLHKFARQFEDVDAPDLARDATMLLEAAWNGRNKHNDVDEQETVNGQPVLN
jgi:hypothetical protein